MKAILRSQASRQTVPAQISGAIQRFLLEQDWWPALFCVGIYRSTPAEPDTQALLEDLFDRRAQVAVPCRQHECYQWVWVEKTTQWRRGAHGISEPASAPLADPADLRAVIVPGVAFDGRGGRLGHGGGHFDRLLAQAPHALRIGLCPESRLVSHIPQQLHDIAMDVVVTEKRIMFMPTAGDQLERLLGGWPPQRQKRAGK